MGGQCGLLSLVVRACKQLTQVCLLSLTRIKGRLKTNSTDFLNLMSDMKEGRIKNLDSLQSNSREIK